MKVLAIETSCDDTCAAVVDGQRVLSNVVSSQVNLHKKWGGVVPNIAKRAHAARIDGVIERALKNAGVNMDLIDIIAVTKGPGLAIALSVGINKAKELADKHDKKLVAVNHIEGHLLSNWAQNREGKPERKIELPALGLTVSGGHTKLVLVTNPSPLRGPPLDPTSLKLRRASRGGFSYKVVGETLDDAAGEALDKAAKLLGFGYPGGPIIEKLAEEGKKDVLILPHPLADKKILDFSFSGLKTSFYYQIKDWPSEKVLENSKDLAATFQEAVFESLLRKFRLATEKYQPKSLLAAGGVLANRELRKRLRKMAKELKLPMHMPVKKILNTDNAAMIGVAGNFKAMRGDYTEIEKVDVEARAELAD